MKNGGLLTVEETAGYLRVTKGTVWRWCRAGKLPATKIGHQWRIRRGELEEMISPSLPASDGAKASDAAAASPLTIASGVERRDKGNGTA